MRRSSDFIWVFICLMVGVSKKLILFWIFLHFFLVCIRILHENRNQNYGGCCWRGGGCRSVYSHLTTRFLVFYPRGKKKKKKDFIKKNKKKKAISSNPPFKQIIIVGG